jgi:hypothetical protein
VTKPEIEGCTARIVDLQTQLNEKYGAYPIWAKMASGNQTGKVYGFRENEVELSQEPSAGPGEKAMRTRVIEQIEEILRGALTIEGIVEIENRVNEAKSRAMRVPTGNF